MSEPLRNYDEAAKWLGVPKSWLEAEVQAGRAPHARLGKHVRFTQRHLDALVAAGERKSSIVPAMPAAMLKPGRRSR